MGYKPFDIITREEWRRMMKELTEETGNDLTDLMDYISRIIRQGKYSKSLVAIHEPTGLYARIHAFVNNVQGLESDNYPPKQANLVYFVDPDGLPRKTRREEYEKMVNQNNINTMLVVKSKETPAGYS